MCSVYILQSEMTGRFYVGSTTDVDRRLSEHLRGHSLATRNRGPWKLVYRKEFDTSPEARRREIEIKSWKSSSMIRELINARVG
jgi:putative endonuclease